MPSWFPYVHALLLLAQLGVMLWAVRIARRSIRAHRELESQKATLAFLRDYNNSQAVDNAVTLLRSGAARASMSDADKLAVKEFLNFFEILAIGLESGIYDERMVFRAFGTDIVKYYDRAGEFILSVRNEDGDIVDVAYERFEALAEDARKRVRKSARRR